MSDPAAHLVEAARTGDRDAQRRLYEEFTGLVHALAVRMVGAEAADDLQQQVFLKVLTTLDRFEGRSRFETWLYRVAVNECLQHLRRSKRRRAVPLEREPVASHAGPDSGVDDRELLEHALGELDADLRSVFVLREMDGLSYRELAEVLEVSEGTVASRLNRARSELRNLLARSGWGS